MTGVMGCVVGSTHWDKPDGKQDDGSEQQRRAIL